MDTPRSFLDQTNSPACLLKLAIPTLINPRNPDALKSHEISQNGVRSNGQRNGRLTDAKLKLLYLMGKGITALTKLSLLTERSTASILKDVVHTPDLKNHPNRRTRRQMEQHHRTLRALLDRDLQTPQQIADLTGIPIVVVDHDLRHEADLKNHPNLILPYSRRKPHEKRHTRNVVDTQFDPADVYTRAPEDSAAYWELLRSIVTPAEFNFIYTDLMADEATDHDLADLFHIEDSAVPMLRKGLWDKIESHIARATPGIQASPQIQTTSPVRASH